MNDKELIEELREYATALRASVHVPHTGADLIERGADALAARQPTEGGELAKVEAELAEWLAGIKMSGHDYGYRNNVELIVALSRTVDPLIAMHRRSLLSMKAAIGGGMSEADVNEIAERSGEVALARAVLGERDGE